MCEFNLYIYTAPPVSYESDGFQSHKAQLGTTVYLLRRTPAGPDHGRKRSQYCLYIDFFFINDRDKNQAINLRVALTVLTRPSPAAAHTPHRWGPAGPRGGGSGALTFCQIRVPA